MLMLEMVDGVCFIEEVPFRGCNCTDAAGREFAYKDVIKMLGEDDILLIISFIKQYLFRKVQRRKSLG